MILAVTKYYYITKYYKAPCTFLGVLLLEWINDASFLKVYAVYSCKYTCFYHKVNKNDYYKLNKTLKGIDKQCMFGNTYFLKIIIMSTKSW